MNNVKLLWGIIIILVIVIVVIIIKWQPCPDPCTACKDCPNNNDTLIFKYPLDSGSTPAQWLGCVDGFPNDEVNGMRMSNVEEFKTWTKNYDMYMRGLLNAATTSGTPSPAEGFDVMRGTRINKCALLELITGMAPHEEYVYVTFGKTQEGGSLGGEINSSAPGAPRQVGKTFLIFSSTIPTSGIFDPGVVFRSGQDAFCPVHCPD